MEEKDLRYYAKVHSVESFGTVDGPGIRFVLFLQGCHLQCKYCHNRDTWDMKGGSYKSLDDIFNKIMNYKNYIFPNGGVTITGGEPLLQAKFIFELFSKLKEQHIHTCIDTSGMVALTEDIKKVLSVTDLVLLDIKHIDDEKCKNLVGKSNKLELELQKLKSKKKNIRRKEIEHKKFVLGGLVAKYFSVDVDLEFIEDLLKQASEQLNGTNKRINEENLNNNDIAWKDLE